MMLAVPSIAGAGCRVERERLTKKGALFGLLAGTGVAVICGVHTGHCGMGSNCEGASCIAGVALTSWRVIS